MTTASSTPTTANVMRCHEGYDTTSSSFIRSALALCMLCWGATLASAQCLNAPYGQFPPDPFTPDCSSGTYEFTGSTSAQLSIVNLVQGVQYIFSTQTDQGVITISEQFGSNALAYGPSPLIFTAPGTGSYSFYSHVDTTCSTAMNSMMPRRITCVGGCLGGGTSFNPSNVYEPICDGYPHAINTESNWALDSRLYLFAGQTYTFSSSNNMGLVNTDNLTVADATNSTVLAAGIDSLSYTPTYSGIYRLNHRLFPTCGGFGFQRTRYVKCGVPSPCLAPFYGLYPSTTFTPSCTGTSEVITATGNTFQYSNVSLSAGVTYTFTSSVAMDYFTVANAAGTIGFAFGYSPLSFTAPATAIYRLVHSANGLCSELGYNRTRSVTCAPGGGCSGPVGSLNPSPPGWYMECSGLPQVITTESLGGGATQLLLLAGETYTFTSSVPSDHFTITNTIDSYPTTFAWGQTPLTYVPTVSTTYWLRNNTDALCGTQNVTRTLSYTCGQTSPCLTGALVDPSGTFTPTCPGVSEPITIFGFAGGYSNVALTAGSTYLLTSSAGSDVLTISDANGTTPMAWGPSPLSFTPAASGTYRFYTHTSAPCGTESSFRTRSVYCANAGGGGTCLTATYGEFPYGVFTPSCSDGPQAITTTGSASEYSSLALTAGVAYVFSSSVATDHFTLANATGTIPFISGITPILFTPAASGTYRLYHHVNAACGTDATARTRSVACATTSGCLEDIFGQNPLGLFTPSCSGPPQTISNGWAGEHSRISLTAGVSYAFTSSVPSDHFTLANQNGTIALAWGETPITFTPTVSAIYRLYNFSNSDCGIAMSSRTRAVTCLGPITNDDCADATLLVSSLSCLNTPGAVTGATNSMAPITCAGSTSSGALDVWYRFVAAGQNTTVTVKGATLFDAVVDIRQGGCTGTTLACADAPYFGGTAAVSFPTDFGSTYHVRVYSQGNTIPGTPTFNICITHEALDPCPLAVDGIANFDESTCSCETGYSPITTVIGSNTVITACTLLCTENITVELRTDALSAQASWQILAQNTNEVLCQFTVPMDGITTPMTENCCLPQGCYRLRVLDSGGDGFITGGYQLRESGSNGRRIIDNFGNFNSGAQSALSSNYENGSFCVPVGDDKPIFSSCDKLDWVSNKFIVASANPVVSEQFGVSNTSSGYEFWFFDPNGTYSFRRFRSHATSDGYGTGALRANHFKVNGWANSVATPHLPANTLLNVRIRGRVAGNNLPFGAACLFKIDASMAACPRVKLQDNPTNTSDYSCGVSRNFGGIGNTMNRIYANPPQPVPTVASNMVRYQFRFRIPDEGVCIVRPPQTSAQMTLNWSSTSGAPLQCSKTYEVDVRVSLNGGSIWCHGPATALSASACSDSGDWGKLCRLTINPCMQGLQEDGATMDTSSPGTFTMYPNPNAGDHLYLNVSHVDEDVRVMVVEIFDMTGKCLWSRPVLIQDARVNTLLKLNDTLAAGVYLVSMNAGKDVHTERLVIQDRY